MIYFLFGEDEFRSRQKVEQIKEKFFKDSQNPSLNFARFKKEDLNFAKIKSQAATAPFLAKKRLLILEEIFEAPKDFREELYEYLSENKLPEETVLVIWEKGKGDQREKLFKFLNKPKTVQEFKSLSTLELEKWIKEKVAELNGKIAPVAVQKLILFVGNDLYRLNQEIQKIVLYADKRVVESDDIEVLVAPQEEENIFAFTDALGSRNSRQALSFLHREIRQGKHELYLLAMILRQLRNLIIVKDLQARGMNNAQIAKESGLHPFVAQKSLQQSGNFTMEELKQTMAKLWQIDEEIKTGKKSAVLALDLFVAEMCS